MLNNNYKTVKEVTTNACEKKSIGEQKAHQPQKGY
jgi:hypothetical protein